VTPILLRTLRPNFTLQSPQGPQFIDPEQYWSEIETISGWYPIDSEGYSPDYENEYQGKSGVYIYRKKDEPHKTYVVTVKRPRQQTQGPPAASLILKKRGYSSTPFFIKAGALTQRVGRAPLGKMVGTPLKSGFLS
jgi:hypothetical protein